MAVDEAFIALADTLIDPSFSFEEMIQTVLEHARRLPQSENGYASFSGPVESNRCSDWPPGVQRYIAIRLTCDHSRGTLSILNDGRKLPKRLGRRIGMGLQGMDYRAEVIGSILCGTGADRWSPIIILT